MATSTELLKEASLNNSFDFDVTQSRLRAELQRSYSYLKEYEQYNVLYEEFIIPSSNTDTRKYKEMGHLHVLPNGDPIFEVKSNNFINSLGREKFRTSDFYNTEFTIDDMYKTSSYTKNGEVIKVRKPNPIFKKIPILMIDDQVIWDWKLTVNKDTLRFRLPFKRNYVIMDERKSFDLSSTITGLTESVKTTIETLYAESSTSEESKTRLCGFFNISNQYIIEPTGALTIEVETVDIDGNPATWTATLSYRILANTKVWERCEYYDIGAKKVVTDTYLNSTQLTKSIVVPQVRAEKIAQWWVGYSTDDGMFDKICHEFYLNNNYVDFKNIEYEEDSSLKDGTNMCKVTLTYIEKFNPQLMVYYDDVTGDITVPVLGEFVYYGFPVIYKDHTIKLLIVDNEYYYRTDTVSLSDIRITDDSLSIDSSLASGFYQRDDGVMMCSIHHKYTTGSKSGTPLELGSVMIPLTLTNGKYIATLPSGTAEFVKSGTGELFISFFFIKNLHRVSYDDNYNITYTQSTETKTYSYPKIEVLNSEGDTYNHPIPIEDFIVCKLNDNNEYTLIGHNNLELFYPNMYSISQTGNYNLYYFYYDDKLDNLAYDNIFEFFYAFLGEKFNDYNIIDVVNDIIINRENSTYLTDIYDSDQIQDFLTIFNKVIEFSDSEVIDEMSELFTYSDTDYLEKHAIDDSVTSWTYKVDTFKEWCKFNPEILRRYVLKQNKLGASYHMYTNQIDLDSRRRKSTAGEIGYDGRLDIGTEDDLKTTLEVCESDDDGAIFVSKDCVEKTPKCLPLFKKDSTGEYIWNLNTINNEIVDGSYVRFEALDPNTNLIIPVNKYINYFTFWNDFITPKTKDGDTFYAVYVKYTGEIFTNFEGEEENRYVFAFSNNKDYPELLNVRVFIDGELVGDIREERNNFMEYLYIPEKYLIDETDNTKFKDSYIEIEVFPSFSFSHTHIFTSVGDSAYINIGLKYEKLKYVNITITEFEDSGQTIPKTIELVNASDSDIDLHTTGVNYYNEATNTILNWAPESYKEVLVNPMPNSTGSDITETVTIPAHYVKYGKEIRKVVEDDIEQFDPDTMVRLEEVSHYISDIVIGDIVSYNDNIPENIFPTLADIYYQQNDNIDIPRRFDTTYFTVSVINEYGEFEVTEEDLRKDKPIKFAPIDQIKVTLNTDVTKDGIELIGLPIDITLNKTSNVIPVRITRSGFPYIEIEDADFNFSEDYMRIYHNGRLMPTSQYILLTSYYCPRIMILSQCEPGDIIYIDITPYRYTQIYYDNELDLHFHKCDSTDSRALEVVGDNGVIDKYSQIAIVDISDEEIAEERISIGDYVYMYSIINLEKYINKPFDIRYYDVYLNGRKLSLNNVFGISETKIIFENARSKYHLAIYERDRDWEYYGLDYVNSSSEYHKVGEHQYPTIDDLYSYEGSFISKDDINKMVTKIVYASKDEYLNIGPNLNIEDPIDYTAYEDQATINVFYYYELIPKHYVNPDRYQFDTDVLKSDFKYINDNYRITANDPETQPDVLMLDPDLYYNGTATDEGMIVYSVGHSGDVSESILAEEIEINNTPNI